MLCKSQQVLGGHTVLWDGSAMGYAVHTHTITLSSQTYRHNHIKTKHVQKTKMLAHMLIICSYQPVPPTSTHTHQQTRPPTSLCSLLIVFVVSGLGLLSIPRGAFGCSVIMHNRFHTLAAYRCVFVSACVWLRGCIRVKMWLEVAAAAVRGLSRPQE